MNLKRTFVALFVSALLMNNANAQQPYGGCWHPKDIKNWSPESDPDAKFNRSKVPLSKRFKENPLMKANANQFYEGQVCNATILFPTCSMCPSQGANNFLGYQPTYWQYMDKLVYWAGSASEGIIIPPPAGAIDAAHQSGVKVLGQIFFPPSAFGGTQAWVREMLTRENGKYVFAIKLFEIAKYLGFDGWFINEETGGGSTSEWVDFIKEFNKAADAEGYTDMEIQWYNASTWPNTQILKAHKNTSQFLEYGSVGMRTNVQNAADLNCTPEEAFSKVYAGIQCVSAGLTGYGRSLRRAFPTTGHINSIDLFCPEEHVWKDNVKSYLNSTENNHGPVAYRAMEATFKNENKMWVNDLGDPSKISPYDWPGISGCVLERSCIDQLPFETSFCVGDGKYRFVEGKKEGTQDWYHSGVQSIMPTWRWWIENGKDLHPRIDWDDAYNFGSSIKIEGKLTQGHHLMRLYKTKVLIENGGTFRIVYKTSTPGSFTVKLGTESSVNNGLVELSNPNVSTKNGWTVADYDLSSLNGKTVYMIALDLNTDNEVAMYDLSLGQIAMTPANYNPETVVVNNLATTSVLGEEKGDLRLTWDYEYNKNFDHFDIYTVTEDQTKTLVGQTRGEGFYIPTFNRKGVDRSVDIQLVPVMKGMEQGTPTTLKVNYPVPETPKVTLSLSKSYVNVGEEVVITANGTGKPTGWEWILPEGVELAEGSSLTSNPIKVIAKKAGAKEITVKATNSIGTSTTKLPAFDVFEGAEINEVDNVALKKKVDSYSGSTNSNEVPSKIIDGVTNPYYYGDKWCNVSADNWVIIDLLSPYKIYGFKIYDGNAGPERGVDQIDNYTIELSKDKEHWTTVVSRENADNISIKTDYISPSVARYVRLTPHVNGTLRIWEFQVFGKDVSNMEISVPRTFKVNAGTKQELVVNYDLKGDERAEKFECTAKTESKNLKIGRIVEDAQAHTFTIPVTASKAIGEGEISVKLNNGGKYRERTVKVIVDSDTQPNILQGKKAEVRQYKADYSFEAQYDTYADVAGLTDGNKAVNACENIENFSMHKNDLWAIFTAPTETPWHLSKVKIYIPDNNQGEADDESTGSVNKDISIYVGNDLNNMSPVKTFENIGETSELEYIFPEYKDVKYLAVVSNMNVGFYPSLAEVEAYEQYSDLIPNIIPMEITSGFNADIIAESLSASQHTSHAIDKQGWVFYSDGVQADGAIAGADRTITSASGVKYLLANYDQNNALWIVPEDWDQHQLKFKEPVYAKKMYVLATSANGKSTIDIEPVYNDGYKEYARSYDVSDWFGDQDGAAVYGLSRIITKSEDIYNADNIDSRHQFRLFEIPVETNDQHQLSGLKVEGYGQGKRPVVLAVSIDGKFHNGATSLGIEDVKDTAKDKKVVGIYSVNGLRLSTLQKGLNIIKYADGSTQKVVIR